jgi:hypothetical protein
MGRGGGWIDVPLARDRSGVYDSDGIDGARHRPCGDADNRNDHGDSQQPDGGCKREGPSCHGSSIRSGRAPPSGLPNSYGDAIFSIRPQRSLSVRLSAQDRPLRLRFLGDG